MNRSGPRRIIILALGLMVGPAVVALLLGDRPVRAADAVAAGQAAEARRLQAEFRRARSPDERRTVAAALLALGADGGRRLHPLARGAFVERLPRYAEKFQHAAVRLLAERRGKEPPAAEIDGLRRTIRETAARPDLSEELIKRHSDPALARLEALFVVAPAEVLAADAALAAERAELLALADWADAAGRLVPERERSRLPPSPTPAEAAAQIDAATELAALLAMPLAPADRQTLAANATVARGLDPEEARGIQRLNQIRVLVGLPAQAIDPALVAACRTHSADMIREGFFAHESPVTGRETPWRRAEAAGTAASAENIAAGMASGVEAIGSWWHSPGHHRNLLGAQRRTGLGRSDRHWTQLFG